MPRNPFKIRTEKDGTTSIRITIPEALWRLSEKIGQDLKLPSEKGLIILLHIIDSELKRGNVKLFGMFESLAREVANEDPSVIGDGLPPIDFSKLHRSERTKSGFAGVYSNGQGFRGDARHANGVDMISIGTFPTAAEAAWRRYLHHQKHGLPYGEFELAIELTHRNLLLKGFPEETLRRYAAYEMGLRGAPTESIPEAYRRWYRENPLADVRGAQVPTSTTIEAIEAPQIIRGPNGKEYVFDPSIDYAAQGAEPANAEERNEERRRQKTCGRCGQAGHNIRSCKDNPLPT